MNPNSDKNRKLMKQYPFIEKILEQPMVPLGPNLSANDFDENIPHEEYRAKSRASRRRIDDLTIKVEVADGHLMYRRPDMTGVDEDSWYIGMEGKRANQLGRSGEYLFAVFKDPEKSIKRHEWGSSREQVTPARYVFWNRVGISDRFTKPMWDEIEYLVWVRIETWHTDTRDDSAPNKRIGELQERNAYVTIYREPKQGFEKLDLDSHHEDFLRLNSRLFAEGYVKNNRDIITLGGRVDELCQLFMDDVWNNGLLESFNAIDGRGMSGKLGDADVRVYYIAGRNVVTLEDQVSQITFKGDSSDNYLGTHSMDGTLPQLRNLVKSVVGQWNKGPEKRELIKPDVNVGIL